jgi:polyhydroxybutyrate depolymerase
LLLKILLGILVVAAVLAGAIAYAAFRLPQPIKIDMSGNRRALLYRLSGGPHPTLIVLHSYSGDALTTAKYSGFLQAALPRGFNIVFPDAVGHEWQDSPEESPAHANDVGFVASLVEKLAAEQIADPHRIFLAGISNGGMMAFVLVCARPELFAGIGTISAGMPKDAFASCRPTKPMRLLMINGDADDVLPYAGGDVGDPGGFFRSVASVVETASLFARANGCDAGGEPRRTSLRDGKRRLERIDWDCPPNASTGVVKVIGGGHDVLGWRNPIEAFLGFPPRGPATAAAIVDRFADARDRARLVRLPSDRPP